MTIEAKEDTQSTADAEALANAQALAQAEANFLIAFGRSREIAAKLNPEELALTLISTDAFKHEKFIAGTHIFGPLCMTVCNILAWGVAAGVFYITPSNSIRLCAVTAGIILTIMNRREFKMLYKELKAYNTFKKALAIRQGHEY